MNKLRYTLYWLAYSGPVPYGEPFTVPASRRMKRRVLKEARHIYGFDLSDKQRAERFRKSHEDLG